MSKRWNPAWCALFLLLVSCSQPANQASNNPAPAGTDSDSTPASRMQQPSAFDYYLFNLSWAPEFCSTHSSSASSSECDPKRHYGFVVHGMWPENNDGSYPQNCAPARPVSQQIVQQMLPIMPDRGLIQHEWAHHGTCSGLSAQDYFALIQKAFQTVQVPPGYRSVAQTEQASPSGLEQAFAQANDTSAANFRVSCSGSQFVGMEVCLTQDLQFRACGQRLKDCRAPQVSILPTP